MDAEPASHAPEGITRLLRLWRGGDEAALDHLIPLVYARLCDLASRHLAHERPDHTLTTAALVHEAYFALQDGARVDWQDRVHFFAVASRTMRRVLVWHARRRHAAKRVDGHLVPLDAAAPVAIESQPDLEELLELDAAMGELEQLEARLCRVVECRYFGGLSVEETATALGVSPATVKRDWRDARAWLRVRLEEPAG